MIDYADLTHYTENQHGFNGLLDGGSYVLQALHDIDQDEASTTEIAEEYDATARTISRGFKGMEQFYSEEFKIQQGQGSQETIWDLELLREQPSLEDLGNLLVDDREFDFEGRKYYEK